MTKAMFGAGCFWGVEELFRQVDGVTATAVGYTGGGLDNPTYEAVCTGNTGHAEVLEIEFDESKVSFDRLLELFWENHDPTTVDRQGVDVGSQYRSAVFYYDDDQKSAAMRMKSALDSAKRFARPIVTEITSVSTFYRAEDYHQNYLEKRGKSHCNF